jgi:hypothetical protein
MIEFRFVLAVLSIFSDSFHFLVIFFSFGFVLSFLARKQTKKDKTKMNESVDFSRITKQYNTKIFCLFA